MFFEIPQVGSVYVYLTTTVWLPVPVNVNWSPVNVAGPDTKVKTPPAGDGINVAEDPLQYLPFVPVIIEPVSCKSKVDAPQT